MKNLTLLLFFSFYCSLSNAQSRAYTLASVPESLKAKASVITHLENISFEVEDLDEAKLKVQKIFTVVNEEGKSALIFNEYSNKYVSLDEAEIKVYDANGKEVEKFKKKNMTTQID